MPALNTPHSFRLGLGLSPGENESSPDPSLNFWCALLADQRLQGAVDEITITRADFEIEHDLPASAGNTATQGVRPSLVLQLRSAGQTGLGEAAPASWIGEDSIEDVAEDLQRWRKQALAEGWNLAEVGRPTFAFSCAAAAAAVDSAFLDLVARRLDTGVSSLLRQSMTAGEQLKTTARIPVSMLIGDPEPSAVSRQISEALERGAEGIKLKIGSKDLALDRRRIVTALETIAGRSPLRLDANRAWTLEQAVAALKDLDADAIEIVEEPLQAPTPEAFMELRQATGLRLGLDESITSAADLAPWTTRRSFDVLVLKQQRVGGLRACMRLAAIAEAVGAGLVITDSIEGAVGSAAALHLAAATAAEPAAVGLGGNALRANQSQHQLAMSPCGPGLEVAPATAAPLDFYNACESWLDLRASRTPNSTALITINGASTYADLKRGKDSVLASLRTLGVRPGDRVALIAAPCRRWVEIFHAVHSLGAILVPIGPKLGVQEVSYQVADCAARVILHDEESSELAMACGAELIIEIHSDLEHKTVESRPAQAAESPLVAGLGADQPLSILYTSGTTGRPKGAILSAGNHAAAAAASGQRLGHNGRDCWLGIMPLHHVGGLAQLVRAVIDGGSVWLHPEFDAALAARLISTGEVTMASMVATMLARTLAASPDLVASPRFRALLLGGGPAEPRLLEEATARGIPIARTYGMTEAASQIATQRPGEALTDRSSCGKPLTGTRLRIDVSGEIQIQSPTLTQGYWGKVPTDAERTSDGWFRTGDLGHLNEDGRLVVEARRSDLILSGGENVYPVEVEDTLNLHPSIGEALVFGVTDPQWGQRVEAKVVINADITSDGTLDSQGEAALTDELGVWCRERLASFKVPKRFTIVDALPRTASGKLLRRPAS